MERRSRISLDSPILTDRMQSQPFNAYANRPGRARSFDVLSPRPKQVPVHQPEVKVPITAPQPVQPKPDIAFPRVRTVATPPVVDNKVVKHPGLPRQSRSNVLKRQMVKQAAKLQRAKHRRPLVPTLLTAMALFLFVAGIFVFFNTIHTNDSVKAQVKQLSKQPEDDGITDGVPSEDEPPTNLNGYNVAPDLPRFFSIEKLDVNARVKRLGVSVDNVLKAPANIFDVGWYDGSAKPGENGTVVLDGHVSGPTKHGVFYNIGSLKAGDKVKLERGDGKVLTYTVTGTQVYEYDKVDMPKVLTSSVPGKAALNFMTCTGRFNVRTNSFEQRIVVFTTQD